GHIENIGSTAPDAAPQSGGFAAPDSARQGGGAPHPFEVWVNGSEQPRGLGALAKTLSMDMRADDHAWLKLKLDALAKAGGDEPFDMPFPPTGEPKRMPSMVSAFAQVVRWRVEQLASGL